MREFFSVLEFRTHSALLDGAITSADLFEWYTEVKSSNGRKGEWDKLRDVIKVRQTQLESFHVATRPHTPRATIARATIARATIARATIARATIARLHMHEVHL